MLVELAPKSHTEVLIPRTCECDLLWKQGLNTGVQVKGSKTGPRATRLTPHRGRLPCVDASNQKAATEDGAEIGVKLAPPGLAWD